VRGHRSAMGGATSIASALPGWRDARRKRAPLRGARPRSRSLSARARAAPPARGACTRASSCRRGARRPGAKASSMLGARRRPPRVMPFDEPRSRTQSSASTGRGRRRACAAPSTQHRPSEAEGRRVLGVLHVARFVDQTPHEVYAPLLDEGTHLGSARATYRVLAARVAASISGSSVSLSPSLGAVAPTMAHEKGVRFGAAGRPVVCALEASLDGRQARHRVLDSAAGGVLRERVVCARW
jgi:hypothetical protein